MNHWCQLPLYVFCFFAPCCSSAQQPKWPLNPTTRKVEFSGILSWPVQMTNSTQRRNLLYNWYVAKLTDEKPEKRVTKTDFKTAKLLDFVYLDSTNNAQDKWKARSIRLLYKVSLISTSKGLVYRLSNFECVEIIFDASNSTSLEEVLSDGKSKELPILAVFYKRLQLSLNSW